MYKTANLREWHKVGKGANGSAYVKNDDPSLLMKLNKKHNATEEFVSKEFEIFRNVKALGISVPDSIEIVKVGNSFAAIYRNILNKKSFSRLLADNKDKFDELAILFAKKAKELTSTECDTEKFENRKEQYHKAIDASKYIDKYKDKLHIFVDTIPDATTCLHGDMQIGNLIQADNEYYWIDLGKFAYGYPLLDVAHLYNLCMSADNIKIARKYIEHITHLDDKSLKHLWKVFAAQYCGITDEKELDIFNAKIRKYYTLDMILRNYYHPGTFSDLVTLIITKPAVKKEFA